MDENQEEKVTEEMEELEEMNKEDDDEEVKEKCGGRGGEIEVGEEG